MKVTQMPPVHAANLVANSGHSAYRVYAIRNLAPGFNGLGKDNSQDNTRNI